MKYAILSTKVPGHILPVASGLHRMLESIQVESKIFSYGFNLLLQDFYLFEEKKTFTAKIKKRIKKLLLVPYLLRLSFYDVIIIVAHVPTAYMTHLKVEKIRKIFPKKPIILYELIYLPLIPEWEKALRYGDSTFKVNEGLHFGLERYDYYLLASNIFADRSDINSEKPYAAIGLNLDDGSLYPEKDEGFLAIVDFARPGFEKEREIQIAALEKTNTRYIVLEGKYSIEDIRKLYRKANIFFIQFLESFGLPICELQACGSYIFTPFEEWCPCHYLSPERGKEGHLSENFIVYNNNLDDLVKKIYEVKSLYNSQSVIETFLRYHRHYYQGNIFELKKFIALVEAGKIHANSHLNYSTISGLSH